MYEAAQPGRGLKLAAVAVQHTRRQRAPVQEEAKRPVRTARAQSMRTARFIAASCGFRVPADRSEAGFIGSSTRARPRRLASGNPSATRTNASPGPIASAALAGGALHPDQRMRLTGRSPATVCRRPRPRMAATSIRVKWAAASPSVKHDDLARPDARQVCRQPVRLDRLAAVSKPWVSSRRPLWGRSRPHCSRGALVLALVSRSSRSRR